MIPILTILLFTFIFPRVQCAVILWNPPYGNITGMQQDTAPAWVSEPRKRGTMGLLYSCTFTLLLCVYNAVHLNVPPEDDSKFSFYLRKTKWVLIALLAPEVVLYTAWSQLRLARWLSREIRNVCGVEFNLMQCFYVVMGGVVVDFTTVKDEQCQQDLHRNGLKMRSTLTSVACQESKITDLPCKSIRDKSKADILAKGLVCFQVSWMVIQTVTRKIQGYPLTVLEVHTLVHVVCALLMYILWLEKPVDVHDPTVIKGSEAEKIWEDMQNSAELNYDSCSHLLPYSPNIDYHRLGNNTEEAIMLLTVCAAYGGVHLAAWNFEFPTESEKVMWRVACIVAMVGTFGSWHIRGLFVDYAEYYRNKGLLAMLKESNARTAARMIFTGTIGIVFALARVVITVESFISLRKVPAGVYATVQWTELVPHF